VYTPNNRVQNYIKQKMTAPKDKISKYKTGIVDFNIAFSAIDRITNQIVSKNIEDQPTYLYLHS
jgi:hypothetical protein